MSFNDRLPAKSSGGGGEAETFPAGTIIGVESTQTPPADYITKGKYPIATYPELAAVKGYPLDVGASELFNGDNYETNNGDVFGCSFLSADQIVIFHQMC